MHRWRFLRTACEVSGVALFRQLYCMLCFVQLAQQVLRYGLKPFSYVHRYAMLLSISHASLLCHDLELTTKIASAFAIHCAPTAMPSDSHIRSDTNLCYKQCLYSAVLALTMLHRSYAC